MKQNAVGLGNICILSTAVLVTLSTTVCLYLGMEDLLNARFPYRITVSSSDASARNLKAVNTALDAALDTAGLPVVQRVQYRYRSFPAALENGTLTNRTTFSSAPCQAYFLTLDDYNQLVRQSCRLEPGETMLFMQRGRYDADEIELYGDSYRIVERLDVFPIEGMASAMMNDACVFVLPDEAAVEAVYRSHMDGEPANEGYNNHWGVDVEGEPEQVLPLFEDLYGRLEDTDAYVECRDEAKTSFYALYGGFLFLGIFIGAVFLMATVLIIYYKQISEGYEDKARFAIMQKVGMTQREIKQTIRSQILLVFFLPLAAAVVHIAVAFKVMTKMLFALNLTNVALFALCTVGTILIFVLFYALVYALTARAYYKIVK